MAAEKKGDYGWFEGTLGIGDVYDTEGILCVGNTHIEGTIFADQSGKLRVYQGMSEANCDDYITEIAFAACAAPGDGEAWTVKSVGIYCRIEILNDSGVAMTIVRMGWKLQSHRGVSR